MARYPSRILPTLTNVNVNVNDTPDSAYEKKWRNCSKPNHFAIYPGHNTFFVGSIKTGDNIVDGQEKQTVSDDNDLTAIRTMNQIIII